MSRARKEKVALFVFAIYFPDLISKKQRTFQQIILRFHFCVVSFLMSTGMAGEERKIVKICNNNGTDNKNRNLELLGRGGYLSASFWHGGLLSEIFAPRD